MEKNPKYYLELIESFTKRDLKARYSGSILGILWIFFYPLSMTLIATLVFSIAFQKTIEGVPYFLFAMIGLISWSFFAQTVIYATRSLIWNRELVSNASFPKDAFVLSISLSKFIDFSLNMIVFFLVFFLSHSTLPLLGLVTFVIILITQILFQAGLSFITSSVNVYYRDVQNALDIILQVVFYLTPILYPANIVPKKFRFLFFLNPLSHIINLYRQTFFQKSFSPYLLAVTFLISLLFFFLGYKIFKKLEKKFADVI